MASTTPATPVKASTVDGRIVQLTPNSSGGRQGSSAATGASSFSPNSPPPTYSAFSNEQDPGMQQRQIDRSAPSFVSTFSKASIPPPGSILTGKQEHYLKRELVSQQTEWEVSELSSPTALQRFGAPFKSDVGEVPPEDSELPLLRFIFVHHVRNFPFLNHAKEKEFWQDKVQVFLQSFASKHISSSEDRLEQTKRAKLAMKAQKLVELMMVSGIPTASGYEERIRFSEMEVVDRGADESGLTTNVPSGYEINGWDVNVAGVRTTSVKRHVRHHTHAEFLLRVKRRGERDVYIGRRYGEFVHMHKKLRLELLGKVLPPLPRKNKSSSMYSSRDDDADSISSVSTQDIGSGPSKDDEGGGGGLRSYLPFGGGSSHKRNASRSSVNASPRPSVDAADPYRDAPSAPSSNVLYREEQRVSLRAFLRNFLDNEQIARSKAMTAFLTDNQVKPNDEEMTDIERRADMDEKRIEEQRRFFEVARQRARELDVHMEKFRRDIVERNGLRNLFLEIRRKNTIAELSPEYKKFAEWVRIEVAATIYHVFLAEDNSPELFQQAKRIHSLVPYYALKQVVRFANPAAVMSGVLDLFLAQPLGAKSLLQRIFSMALGDGIRSVQRSIDALTQSIDEPKFCEKIKNYTEADEDVKEDIREEARREDIDLLVKILQSDEFTPELGPEQIGRAFNAYVAWNNAVENVSSSESEDGKHSDEYVGAYDYKVDVEMRIGAELFAYLKQLLKLYTRQRDKTMMLRMIEEPTTLQLFRNLFTIFYEPLVRVYKSANVYNSVTDFARFADDAINTVEKCQRQDVAADPNQTVQAFIDLCQRHEESLYHFIHEVHIHDDGLFDKLMAWIEGILDFLRNGPKGGKLDMNALFLGAAEMKQIDQNLAVREINSLIKWQTARKKWHQDKTRQKMASGGEGNDSKPGLASTFQPGDFGLNAMDLQDLDMGDEDEDDSSDENGDEDADPIVAERKRRAKKQDTLKRTAGEPVKPDIKEVHKMKESFLAMLRMVLAE